MLEPISENKATTLQTKLSGTERAMKVLDQIKLQFPNITDEEISDLVTKIKAKRSVEENIVKNDNESNIPNWSRFKYLEPSDPNQSSEKRYLRNLDKFGGGAEGNIYEIYDSILDKVLLAKSANKELEAQRIGQEAKTLVKLAQKPVVFLQFMQL